jgi:hypothetical protein
MNEPKYFDLNLGDNVLTHLEPEDALKEIISNSLDEHYLTKTDREIKIANPNGKWQICDFGRGIITDHFKFSKNIEKEGDDNIIGMYGFGLKDSIGILYNKNIKFKIYTKKYIFTPVMRTKKDFPDEETLHIEVIKNTTREVKKGTEFVFDNLTLDHVNKAKNKFIKFINPEVFFEDDECKIFKLKSYQSIFINGVEVNTNTGLHFSYDIKSSEKIRRYFNRDRKQLDIGPIKSGIIVKILQKIDYASVVDNPEFFGLIREIMASDKNSCLQEFGYREILRSIISDLNETNSYVFVDPNEKLAKKIKSAIDDDERELFYLGDSVKTKFNIASIKELYNHEKMGSTRIVTSLAYKPEPKPVQSKEHLEKHVIIPIEKLLFKIPFVLKKKILNTEVVDDPNFDSDTDEDVDSGYDFTGDRLKITRKNMNEHNVKKTFATFFKWIVDNVDTNVLEEIVDKPMFNHN